MPLQKIGLNFSNIGNVTPLNISFPTSAKDFITEIPKRANEVTQGYFGLGVLLAMFVVVMQLLYDEFGGFRFSILRSVAITSIICSFFGLFCINIGYFSNYYHVVLFLAIAFISTIWVIMAEN